MILISLSASNLWIQKKLDALLSVNSGKDYKHLKIGNIPVYGTGGYMLSVDEYLTQKNAVGIGRKGTINKPQLLKGPFWTVDTLFYLLPNQNLDLAFLYYLTQNINWNKYDESSGVPSLSGKTIKNIKVKIPKIDEQNNIGELLKKLDSIITLEQKKLNLIKKYKGYFSKNLFANANTSPQIRFNNFKGEWLHCNLKELGTFNSGNSFPSDEQKGNTGIPFFKVSDMNNISNETVMNSANNYVNKKQIEDNNWKPINSLPAIIFAKVGAALLLNRKRIVKKEFLIDNNLMSFSFNEKNDSKFGYFLFQNILLPRYAKVGALPSYNQSDISIIPVKIPTIEEQRKIGILLYELQNIINLKQEKIKKYQNTKSFLLQRLFI